jgi:hypothetical protein
MKNPLFLTGFWTLLDCAGLDSGGDEGDRTYSLNTYNYYVYLVFDFLHTPKYTPKLIKIINFTKLILA